jgi:hypothetical protein
MAALRKSCKQRWLIVESAERKQSDIQKLNSKIEQEKIRH